MPNISTLPPNTNLPGQCTNPSDPTPASDTPPTCPDNPNTPPDPERLTSARPVCERDRLEDKALELMKGSSDDLLLRRIQAAHATTELPLARVLLLLGDAPAAASLLENGLDTLDTLKNLNDVRTTCVGLRPFIFRSATGAFCRHIRAKMRMPARHTCNSPLTHSGCVSRLFITTSHRMPCCGKRFTRAAPAPKPPRKTALDQPK